MAEEKQKLKAKEPPKKRFVWLFLLTAAFCLFFCALGAGWFGSLLLGILLGAVSYFLFVVLKAHRLMGSKLKGMSEEERKAHAVATNVAREIARNGIVLLQNEDALLPLPKGAKLNLIGLCTVQMNYNGGGSAASDESKCTTLEKALRETGFELNEELLNLSYNYLQKGKASIAPTKHLVKQGGNQKGGAEFSPKPGNPVKTELPLAVLTDNTLYPDGQTVLQHARDYSEYALVVLSRGGGEGYDLDPADLRLIDSEKQLLEETAKHFENIILVLNTANTVEMGWLKDYPQIKSVLWIGFPGVAGTLALGDILCGDVSPSGKLPDTWAASNLAAPAANNFCQLADDGSWSKRSFHYSNAPEKKGYFVRYSEGIYVGYRYFETRAAIDPHFCYEKEVVWPFGHGLSYTTFSQKLCDLTEDGEKLILTASITNTGNHPGRDVLQCYLTAPYTGRVERSVVELVGFAKTGLLQPGESEEICLQLDKRDLGAFEEATGKYILEAGTYNFSLQRDSHTRIDAAKWELAQILTYDDTTALFADAATVSLTRGEFKDAAHPAFTGPTDEEFIADEATLAALKYDRFAEAGLENPVQPSVGTDHGLKLADVRKLPKNHPDWEKFVQQLTEAELCDLCGNGAWQTVAIPRLGVPRTLAPDGPTSLASTMFSALVMGSGKAGITWPCPSILAASFDRELALGMGEAVGAEGHAMGYRGWYAPAMNLHRTAFNSRNFEYYSEDPLLSGKTAAQVVRGAQSRHVGVYIKHFALNERETNTRDQLFTWCGEQAMRQLYLRPFELAVKEGGAWGVMSSFNYIGRTWAGGNSALLTDLLRKEWGFEGAVVTDACVYPYMDVVQMIRSGGSLALDTLGGFTGGNGKRKQLLAMVQQPEQRDSLILHLQRAAKDILYMVSQTMDA